MVETTEKEKEENKEKTVVPKSKSPSLSAAQAEPAKKKEVPGPDTTDEKDELGIPVFIRKKIDEHCIYSWDL